MISTRNDITGIARNWPIAAQALLAGGGLLAALLMPPSFGTMMLVPMTQEAARQLPALALDGETQLIATGPLPGSLIVQGSRAALIGKLLAAGIVPIASQAAGCAGAAVQSA